jgi:hypothetical protein
VNEYKSSDDYRMDERIERGLVRVNPRQILNTMAGLSAARRRRIAQRLSRRPCDRSTWVRGLWAHERGPALVTH